MLDVEGLEEEEEDEVAEGLIEDSSEEDEVEEQQPRGSKLETSCHSCNRVVG